MDTQKKKLLLFTSEQVGFTGQVSFKFLFEIEGAYDKYEEAKSELWGYAHKDKDKESVVCFNLFRSGKGLHLGGAFGQGDFDKVVLEDMPQACSMVCTTEVADMLEKLIGEQVQITRLFSEKTLLTS